MNLDLILVRHYFSLSGKTDTQIAKETNLSKMTVHNAKIGKNVKIEHVNKIAAAVGIPIEILMSEQGRGVCLPLSADLLSTI